MSIDNIWTAGGIVSIPLLGFSVLAIALIIERIVFWWRVKNGRRRICKEVLSLYRSDRFAALDKLRKNAHLPIARIFLEAIELEEPTPAEFRLALDSAVQAEIPVLRKFGTWFQTIITASPLLGLLGTIIGLIQSFAAMDLGSAAANTTGVTGGLSEALISTVMGLVVAIFTLLFANTFRGLYLRELAFIQEIGGQLELVNRRHHQNHQGAKEGVKEYATHN
ncbi:MAG: MotA/TolQ/ExbB proton channel family protein [Cyanobacteria bacterium P01_G01_bin.19]